MNYIPPLRFSGPSSSYRNADPANGVRGSIPQAAAIEYPMREIVALITALGLTPSNSSREQMAEGIVAALAAKQDVTATLTALAGLTLGAFADDLLSADDASDVLTLLGLVIGTDVQAYDANTAKLNVAQSWTKAQRAAYVTLTDAATLDVDMSLGNNFKVTLGGNRTLGAPTNLVAGQSGIIEVIQDGTGSRTLSYNAAYSWGSAGAPTLSTTAGKVDLISYQVLSDAATVRLAFNKAS